MTIDNSVIMAALGMAVLAFAGCLTESDALAPRSTQGPDGPLPAFSAPQRIPLEGYAYEPSLVIASDGTLVVTAHKGHLTNEGTRLSSWLVFSRDGGATWDPLPSPLQAHEGLFAFEGDLAVDANDRLYFVDTYWLDQTISRWSLGGNGPTWDYTIPLQRTLGVDDRPWLDARGDGIVHLLARNNIHPYPAPNTLTEPGDPPRFWFYTSEDAGLTWNLGHGFVASGWCSFATFPGDDATVSVVCSTASEADDGVEFYLYNSKDLGRTWESSLLAHTRGPNAMAALRSLGSTAADQAGWLYHVWNANHPAGEYPGELNLARADPGGSSPAVLNLTPFDGTFTRPWISATGEGRVAITFYGTPDVPPTDSSLWYAYLLDSHDARADEPSWRLVLLDHEAVAQHQYGPVDFFMNRFGPDGSINVVYQHDASEPFIQPEDWLRGYDAELRFTREMP